MINGVPFIYDVTTVSNSETWYIVQTSAFPLSGSQNTLGSIQTQLWGAFLLGQRAGGGGLAWNSSVGPIKRQVRFSDFCTLRPK